MDPLTHGYPFLITYMVLLYPTIGATLYFVASLWAVYKSNMVRVNSWVVSKVPLNSSRESDLPSEATRSQSR